MNDLIDFYGLDYDELHPEPPVCQSCHGSGQIEYRDGDVFAYEPCDCVLLENMPTDEQLALGGAA